MPYVGEKVPYVRKKETVPFGVPFLCRHISTPLLGAKYKKQTFITDLNKHKETTYLVWDKYGKNA